MYKKRSGTSGIRGQLYETKLVSLLLFRARHDDNFEEFQLASNVDGIGAFDDICIRAKLKGSDRPVALFIQAKHREGDNVLTLNNKNDLAKYFDSYLKIRRSFKPNNKDVLFNGIYEETECFFVLYTNADGDVNNASAEGEIVSNLDALMSTDEETASQTPINDQNVSLLCELALEDQITSLAARLVDYFFGKLKNDLMLDDGLIARYHVILAQKVVNVSDVPLDGNRDVTFRKSFFESKDRFVKLFKDELAIEVLKTRKVDDEEVSELLTCDQYGSDTILAKLIGSVIMYNAKNGMLEFINKRTPENLKRRLAKIYVSKSDVDETIHWVAKKILISHSFKVPAAFGNKDLTIRGKDEKIEKRLIHLTSTFQKLLEKPHPNNIVTIDESLGGFLQLNGGIAGAVGNIFVLDENTELMRFTDDCELLGDLAKNFLSKLKTKIPNLLEYKFEVKVYKFPKLSLNYSEHEKNLAKDFFDKLLFYTNQADESRVEEILINEIEDLQCSNDNNFRATSHAIFLTYHDNIQNWWKTPDKGLYLDKDSQVFDKTIGGVVKEPLMSTLNVIYRNRVKNINYVFNKDSMSSLNLQDPLLSTIVVTESSTLTVAKVVQYCKNKDHVVLDLEYIINLPMDDCTALCTELKNTNENKILIFVCDNLSNSRNRPKIFKNIVKATNDKVKIIITNQILLAVIEKQFRQHFNLINDITTKLNDLSEESRAGILHNARVIFQGEEVPFDFIIDEELMMLIEGEILNKFINRDVIVIGDSLSNSNYEEIKHLYVNRYLNRDGEPCGDKVVETLDEIKDDVVLVTAIPGMGKSTLLTHLSLKTKADEQRVWVVRINLLDYSREFNMWQKNKTVIDTLESLNFMCQAILKEEHGKINRPVITLEYTDGEVYIKDCVGDQATVIQMKIFLHFYNKRRIIFLFDGFDEICPHYASEVMQLLKTVRNYPRKHKMWVASRSYNEIQSILQREFGILYEIQHLSMNEMETYLYKFWDSYLILQEFDAKQLKNVQNFIKFMENSLQVRTRSKLQNLPLHEIYFNVLKYMMNKIRLSSIPLWDYESSCSSAERKVFNYFLAHTQMRFVGSSGEANTMYKFLGTPLHLYLMADYFQNEIKDVSKEQREWSLDINTFTIYERFLEAKLKTIRFQEKNKMDIYKPDVMITYEKEKADFVAKHKRLATYAIFGAIQDLLFSKEELNDIESMLAVIKQGEEKTGLIYSVTSFDMPIFVHRTFAEYFAVEYICDVLKNEKNTDKLQSVIRFVLTEVVYRSPANANVRSIFDSKLMMDEAVMGLLTTNGQFIFNVLFEQAKYSKRYDQAYDDDGFYSPIEVLSLYSAVSDDLNNFVSLFLSILQTQLNQDTVDDFIDIIRESRVFGIINVVKYKEFLNFSLDSVRRLKPSGFNSLFHICNFSFLMNFYAMSNERIFEVIETNAALFTK